MVDKREILALGEIDEVWDKLISHLKSEGYTIVNEKPKSQVFVKKGSKFWSIFSGGISDSESGSEIDYREITINLIPQKEGKVLVRFLIKFTWIAAGKIGRKDDVNWMLESFKSLVGS
ncbi:MAG: hypothetical protein H7644_14600 [Candidatus Heimdallarchaeota archaeon]|nr:hypothetical protein [Candidatus Heimdallarchaeota archaeon]MCK5144993.1 hypothetical protein [Candidatus Heimdallarchaeota archaeon]